jgi:hypothetical protein
MTRIPELVKGIRIVEFGEGDGDSFVRYTMEDEQVRCINGEVAEEIIEGTRGADGNILEVMPDFLASVLLRTAVLVKFEKG